VIIKVRLSESRSQFYLSIQEFHPKYTYTGIYKVFSLK